MPPQSLAGVFWAYARLAKSPTTRTLVGRWLCARSLPATTAAAARPASAARGACRVSRRSPCPRLPTLSILRACVAFRRS